MSPSELQEQDMVYNALALHLALSRCGISYVGKILEYHQTVW